MPSLQRISPRYNYRQTTKIQICIPWLKIQDYFQSGGTTLPEYQPGGITKSEQAWWVKWTKYAIINQHARGGIT